MLAEAPAQRKQLIRGFTRQAVLDTGTPIDP